MPSDQGRPECVGSLVSANSILFILPHAAFTQFSLTSIRNENAQIKFFSARAFGMDIKPRASHSIKCIDNHPHWPVSEAHAGHGGDLNEKICGQKCHVMNAAGGISK